MATKKQALKTLRKPTAEGRAMDAAFKKAAKQAKAMAFTVRKTIMVERDGWLVMVNKAGKVTKRVQRLEPVKLP
jgi:hypothetical protein